MSSPMTVTDFSNDDIAMYMLGMFPYLSDRPSLGYILNSDAPVSGTILTGDSGSDGNLETSD